MANPNPVSEQDEFAEFMAANSSAQASEAPDEFEAFLNETERGQTHVQRRRAQREGIAGNTGINIPLNETTLPSMGTAVADVMNLGAANPIAGVEHGIGAKLSQFAAELGVDTEGGEGLFDAAARLMDLDTTNEETFGEAYDRGYQRRADMSEDAYDANPGAYEAGRLIPEVFGANRLNSAMREPFEQGLSQIQNRAGRYIGRLMGNTAGDVAIIAGSNALSGGAREGTDVFTDPEDAGERFVETAQNPFVLGSRTALSAANRAGIGAKSLAGPGEFRVTPDRVAASQAQGGRSIAMGQTGEAADEMLPMLSGDRVTQDSVKTFRFINNALRNVLKDSGLSGDDVSARTARVFNDIKHLVPSSADGRTTLAQLIERSFAKEFPEFGEDFATQIRTFLLGAGLKERGSTARTIQQMRESQIDDYNTLIDETFGTTNPGVEEQTVAAEIKRLSEERRKSLTSFNTQANQSELANKLRGVIRDSEDAGGVDFQARGFDLIDEFVEADPFTAANDLSVYLNEQMGRAAGDPRAYTAIKRSHSQLEPLLAQVPNWRPLTTDINQQILVRENLGYIDGFGTKNTGFGTDFRKSARDPDMPERMVDYQVGRYEGTNPRQANALARIENSQTQIDGQKYNRRQLALQEQQRAAQASLGETVRAPLNRSRPGGTNAEGQDIVGLNMSQMQREGDLVAMERLLGDDGARFAQGVDSIVDQRQFLADIDPRTGSNTVNKANALADGDSVMTGLPRQLTGNAGPANITDALLLASGMPPINFLTRIAPQTVQRVFGPGRRTRQNISNALLQRPNLAPPRQPNPNALDALPRRSGRNQRRRQANALSQVAPVQGGVPSLNALAQGLNTMATNLGERRLGVGHERMLPITNTRRQQHAMREAGVRLQSGVRPIETAQNPEKLANALEQAAKPIVRRDQEGFAYVERGPAGELIDESIAPINLRQQAALEGHKRNVQTYREGLRRIEADRKAAQGNITATARARAEIDRLVRSLGLDPEAQKRLLTLHDSQFKNGKPLRASALPAPQLNQADEAISGIAQRQANDLANDMMAGREAEYAPRNRQDPNFVRSMLDPRESANADRIMSGRDLADPKTVGRLELGARTAAGVAALGGGGAALSSWEPETDRRTTAPVPLNALPSPIEPRGNDVIARAQMALTQSGFDPGAVDGIMGKNTAIAIAQAEASFGMPITGQWSEELETALLQRPPMLDDQAAREGAPIRAR